MCLHRASNLYFSSTWPEPGDSYVLMILLSCAEDTRSDIHRDDGCHNFMYFLGVIRDYSLLL